MTVERAEPTSQEIRRVALEMFATKGYDATSVRDIAAVVGIRGATLYHHFGSKEEILWDLTLSALEAISSSWKDAERQLGTDDPTERLRAFVRAHVVFHIRRQTDAAIVNAQLNRLSPDHFQEAVALRSRYERELTAIVESCLATGQHTVPDLRVTVFAILQMTTAVTTWYQPDGPLSVDELASVYAELAVKMIA
ncbi:TetR/AcrR family transcriptional regulator [Aeromicrobium wangtongii]|uniref:TetR/AcrR family transcriptional regulator n=1 Tax=Aeromicrobium wangtongii TaxID=2969247 RepID=UPI00201805CC|nr:TetR/AcrR family transcriptional regulator [Aeromicrobium wangtongii]MCL3818621.1 TetR/AcrR family transcriptional regulator [Aeromicrobium wangtongii]